VVPRLTRPLLDGFFCLTQIEGNDLMEADGKSNSLEFEEREISSTRVFSGVQPSGDLHLGNYLGAIRGWVQRQSEKENFFCIVDLHALTVPQDPKELQYQTRAVAALYFASGLDPAKCVVFVQSHLTEHAEASWLLNCVTPVGWLERMTQFKDKTVGNESISAGLLGYPVLMAADIILYDANEVPVGDDQKQHVELTRDIAQRFNHLYGQTFVIPKPVIPDIGARIMGLDNPVVKMAKTYSHVRGHLVKMVDDPEEIERSFKRAVTDSGNEIRFSDDKDRAGVNNLLGIYRVITGKTKPEVEAVFVGARGYGDLKKRVAEVVIEELAPIRKRYHELMGDIGELDRLLEKGADRARAVSGPKLQEIKRRMGLAIPGFS